MAKSEVEIPIDGFGAGEIDFGTMIGPTTASIVISEVVDPAVQAEAFPADGSFCAITIIGHSDRVDTPGLGSEQRRTQELDASIKRAESTSGWLFAKILSGMLAVGVMPPTDWVGLQRVVRRLVPCGAADLVHKIPLGELQRAQNRRVQILVTIFAP